MRDWNVFGEAGKRIQELDFSGMSVRSAEMLREYKIRNSLGLYPSKRIHRIFQREYLEADIADGVLTLPRATPQAWGEPLENPLSDVMGADPVTGRPIHYGNVASNFYALCWTHRLKPKPDEWMDFGRGREATRISTTVGKVLDQLIVPSDPAYMFRAWILEAEYKRSEDIVAMKSVPELLERLESSGVLLACSAATVPGRYIDEAEVRLLYDGTPNRLPNKVIRDHQKDLIRVPFSWEDVIDAREEGP